MKNEIKFTDDVKVIDLTLDELRATADYQGGSKHEVSHHQLFSDVIEDLENRGYVARVDKLHVSKTGIKPPTPREVERKGYKSVYDITGTIVNNCIGRIAVDGEDFSNDKTHTEIAISYNKQGIALAMGQHVNICSNMNIFGGQMIQNYGSQGMPFLRMLEILSSWIQNMRKYRKRDMEILKALQSTEIDPIVEVDTVVGNLHRLCEMNKKNTKIIAPLSHSRIHDMQRGMMNFEGELATAYHLYQAATEVSTHQQVIENRLENTGALGLYFQERYKVIKEIAEEAKEPVKLT